MEPAVTPEGDLLRPHRNPLTLFKNVHRKNFGRGAAGKRRSRRAPSPLIGGEVLGVTEKMCAGFLQPSTFIDRLGRAVWVCVKNSQYIHTTSGLAAADIKMHLPSSNVPLADIELPMCAFNRCQNNACFAAE
jgi:hypothetical protein